MVGLTREQVKTWINKQLVSGGQRPIKEREGGRGGAAAPVRHECKGVGD